MAFNDMNSWDEDPDELLRRRWQQAFADFEVQPRSLLSQRILGQLSAKRRRKATRWLVVTGLLLLLSAGLIYQGHVVNRAGLSRGSTLRSKPTLSSRLLPARWKPPTEGRTEPGRLLTQAVAAPSPNRIVSNEHPSGSLLLVSKVEAARTEAWFRRHTPAIGLDMDKPRIYSPLEGSQSTTRLSVRPPRRRSVHAFTTHFFTGPTGVAQTSGSEPIVTTAHPIGTNYRRFLSTNQSSTNQSSINTLSDNWTKLNPRGLSLVSQLRVLPDQLPVTLVEPQSPVRLSVVGQHWHWFVDVVPLSSFQWMSVSAMASNAYLSNVSAPAAFSPATWGYQLNGGVRFRHWLAYVATGQLRRWAYYTVNENRYTLVPTATDPHQLVREVHTVAENTSLPMIGAGLSQQRLLAHGRYAIELGGQVSYLPTSGQPLIGLQGGATRRLLLNGRTELQVGLRAEYGLNHLFNDQQQLLIHPLVLGIGLRLQPRY